MVVPYWVLFLNTFLRIAMEARGVCLTMKPPETCLDTRNSGGWVVFNTVESRWNLEALGVGVRFLEDRGNFLRKL